MKFNSSPIRLAAALLALATAVACSKKADDVTPTPAPTPGWKVNGNTVAATFRTNTASTTSIAVIGEFGTGTAASRVVMQMPRRAGTFAVSGAEATATYTEGSNFYSSRPGSGSIVVSSYSANNITGTFSFKAYRAAATDTVRTVSGGAFNINY